MEGDGFMIINTAFDIGDTLKYEIDNKIQEGKFLAIDISVFNKEEAKKYGMSPIIITYDLAEDEYGRSIHLLEKWALQLNPRKKFCKEKQPTGQRLLQGPRNTTKVIQEGIDVLKSLIKQR
jgi:ABC-type uncharacterized transport system involved in gliding motility auxiliary subunit